MIKIYTILWLILIFHVDILTEHKILTVSITDISGNLSMYETKC